MITAVSQLLKGFMDEEREKLDDFSLSHGPTIGEMYEGLTSAIFNKAIPPQLSLQIVKGFINDDSGTLTGQIDCMLVTGNGIPIPFTDNFKWHVKDVIAVLEVKKTLYSADLADSFTHLRDVIDRYSSYLSTTTSQAPVDTSFANHAFAQITGTVAPAWSRIRALPSDLGQIYHALLVDQLSPVRIVLGYHGFQSELALRQAFVSYLSGNVMATGYGILSFPHLIICGENSLIKLNGQPYNGAMRSDLKWDFYASSKVNPVLLLLELIWTKLERLYGIGGFWGEDLQIEVLHPLLCASPASFGGLMGWAYGINDRTDDELREDSSLIEWQPNQIDIQQFTVLNRLGSERRIDTSDPEFIAWLISEGKNPQKFVTSLVRTGLVARSGDLIQLTTEQLSCAALPNGQFVAAENNTGRLDRWIEKQTFS